MKLQASEKLIFLAMLPAAVFMVAGLVIAEEVYNLNIIITAKYGLAALLFVTAGAMQFLGLRPARLLVRGIRTWRRWLPAFVGGVVLFTVAYHNNHGKIDIGAFVIGWWLVNAVNRRFFHRPAPAPAPVKE